MKKKELLLLLITVSVPLGPAQARQTEKKQHRQQSDFSMEQVIVPIRKPVRLPDSALKALRKDPSVSSCLADENLPNERALASWFVASEIDLGKPGEADLIVLPAEVFAPAAMQPSPNACFFGPYTMTFWVLRKVGTGYDVVLSINAHDMTVRRNRWTGYREIETSVSNMRGTATTLYRFDGHKYVKYKETFIPPG